MAPSSSEECREKTFALSDISIQVSNSNNSNPSPAAFNTNMSFSEFQAARDTQVANTSIVTYDDTGYPHTVNVTFTPSQEPDKWLWDADTNGSESIVAGQRGTITFGPDGTVSSFSFQDGSSTLQIDPQNGAGVMSIKLNPGGSGQYSGLTQFAADTTATAASQDGYTMGALKSISMSEDGVVQGFFDNGTTRALAKILIAQFTNPGGLEAQSNNVFAATANSGDPVLVNPGTGNCSLKSGTLEMSNVDIAEQFTQPDHHPARLPGQPARDLAGRHVPRRSREPDAVRMVPAGFDRLNRRELDNRRAYARLVELVEGLNRRVTTSSNGRLP